MAGLRKEFNKQETQKYIKEVFISIYKKKGIDGITVSEICNQAKIAKSTFYFYYEDKYSVLEQIENDLLDGLEEIRERYESNYAEFIGQHLEEFRAVMGPKGDPSFETRWRADITKKYDEVFKATKKDKETEGLATTIFISTLLGVFRYFIFEKPDTPNEKISSIIDDALKYTLEIFKG